MKKSKNGGRKKKEVKRRRLATKDKMTILYHLKKAGIWQKGQINTRKPYPVQYLSKLEEKTKPKPYIKLINKPQKEYVDYLIEMKEKEKIKNDPIYRFQKKSQEKNKKG